MSLTDKLFQNWKLGILLALPVVPRLGRCSVEISTDSVGGSCDSTWSQDISGPIIARVWIYKGYRTIRWCSCGVGKGKSLNVEMVYTQHSEVAQSYLKIAGSLMFPEECRKVKLQRVASEQELEEWSWLIHKETRAFRKDVHPAKWFSPLQSRSIRKRGDRSPELRWRLGHETSVALRTKCCKLPKLQNSEQTSHRLAPFPLQGRT